MSHPRPSVESPDRVLISGEPWDRPVVHAGGFSLVELLISMAILSLLVGLLLNMTSMTSRAWKTTRGKIEQFRDARIAFTTITRRLSQATLNTYLDYDVPSNPVSYMRQSELRFLSGPTTNILSGVSQASIMPTMAVFFQAPLGFATNTSDNILQNSLNTWGYFIEYAGDTNNRPAFINTITRNRFRLMELMEPTESLSVYNYTATNRSYTNVDWITNSIAQSSTTRPVHLLAENVIALIFLPKLAASDMATWNAAGSNYTYASLATNYVYSSAIANSTDPHLDTHNQLPPTVQVTMVAIDETSAVRFPTVLLQINSNNASLFTNAANFTNDLNTLQSALSTNNVNFRVFTTDVMLKAAKWSTSQTN